MKKILFGGTIILVMIVLSSCAELMTALGVKEDEMAVLTASTPSISAEVGDPGKTITLTADLPISLASCQWSNSNPDAADLTAAGGSAIFKPKSEGTGVISIAHSEADTLSIAYRIDPAKGNDAATGSDKFIYLGPKSATSWVVSVGDTMTLGATLVNGKEAENLNIQWQTEDDISVRLIGTTGTAVTVEAVSVGMAIITAVHSSSSNSLRFSVLVRDEISSQSGSANGLSLKEKYLESYKTNYTADIGDTVTLSATLINGNTLDDQSISWSSTDNDFIQLIGNSGSGISVIALTSGTAVINASHPDSLNVLTFSLFVAEDADKYIIPNKNALLLTVGDVASLSVTYYGGDALEQLAVAWTSGDSSVARLVGESGTSVQVMAVAEGATVITPTHPASQNNPPITVLVIPREAPPETVKYFTLPEQSISMEIGEQKSLKVRFIGASDLEEQDIQWNTDGSDVLDLLGNKGTRIPVQAIRAGTCILTVSHPESKNTVSLTVRVQERQRTLSLSRRSLTLKKSDPIENIRLIISNGVESDYENLQWTSSNEDVVLVHGNGEIVTINPVGPGVSTIAVVLLTTEQKATMTVIVEPDKNIVFSEQSIRIELNQTGMVNISSDPPSLNINLRSSDPQGFSYYRDVSNLEKIIITAKKEGNYSLIATSPGGIRAVLNIECFIVRDFIVPDEIIMIQPNSKKIVPIEIIPVEENQSPDFKLIDDELIINDSLELTYSFGSVIIITKDYEMLTTIKILDKRKGRSVIKDLKIGVVLDNIEHYVTDPGSFHRRNESNKTYGIHAYQEMPFQVEIDPRVRVMSFHWNYLDFVRGSSIREFRLEYPNIVGVGNNGARMELVETSSDNRSAVIKWFGDKENVDRGDNVNTFYGEFSYTIIHGIPGNEKSYTRHIYLEGDAH